MTRVKVCGIPSPELALLAARARADLLGVVFHPPSPRCITEEQAKAIRASLEGLPFPPKLVGVFVNFPSKEVNRLASTIPLDMVQLHGDEPWSYCQEIERPFIKAVRVRPGQFLKEVLSAIEEGRGFLDKGNLLILDTHVPGIYGGTGHPSDWKVARGVASRYPLLLAGGLTPDNVARAIATVRPWGVDVSSGVETNGAKDPAKIMAFLHEVKSPP